MKREVITTAKTVEAAVSAGAEQLGVEAAAVTYEVLEAPKKGFLGFGEVPARVRVEFVVTPESSALEFVRTILGDMDVNATAEITADYKAKRDRLINISGGDAGILIGHHGETLEALQYLVNLAANRREEDDGDSASYVRFTLDIEGYRQKREDTLKKLAHRMAERVLKYNRNVMLEPMNPYERRIIHSEVQQIEGVTTTSVGADNNRRVVIYPEGGEAPTESKARGADRQQSRRGRGGRRGSRPAPVVKDGGENDDVDTPIFEDED